MNTQKMKSKRAERRRFRVRKSIYGTPQKPRLSVSRSNLHISAQLIDDLNGITLAAATSAGKNSGLKHGSNVAAAKAVGQKLAEAAKPLGYTLVILLDDHKICELDEKNRIRWTLEKIAFPLDGDR